MKVLKCVFIQPGLLILINFIFVSRAHLSKEAELFGFYSNTTISSFEINEDEDEFFFRTFEYAAIQTLAVLKSVSGFHDELSAEIKEIKDEKIKRLENKIKQLEENDGRSEEENSSIDEEHLDLEIFNTTSVKSDVYDEHEFRQSYYSRKMPDVFRLIKSNQKLIDKMQSVRNEITADRFVSNYIRTRQTSSESELETVREVVLKLVEKQVPPKNISDYARSAIESINLIIEQHRERFNSIIIEMDDKIHHLNERIREMEENKPSKNSQHTIHEEL